MSEATEPRHLNSHQQETLNKLFAHPTSHNLEWHDVQSLLSAVGAIEPRHDEKIHVTIGESARVFERPRDKDVDVEMIVALRHMLSAAGYRPEAE